MPWLYLTPAKLLTKANVLAGPILREVTADFVSVWFALQKKATVKLTVMTKTGVRLFDGSRDTIAVATLNRGGARWVLVPAHEVGS